MNYWTQSKDNIFVAAHRGWSAKYPENTLEAFKEALEIGVDQIETDVRISADGELVLIHDATLDRTTNGRGLVCEHTLSELKKLDAGNGSKIPTFVEFMELVKDHPTVTLDIELKEYPRGDKEAVSFDACDRVLQIIDEYGFSDRCVINSFDGKLNEYVYKKYCGRYKQHLYYPPKHMDLEGCSEEVYSFGYCACVFGYAEGRVTLEEIKDFHKNSGIRIWAGAFVKDEATLDMAVDMGAELITCNNPDDILKILRHKGLHK